MLNDAGLHVKLKNVKDVTLPVSCRVRLVGNIVKLVSKQALYPVESIVARVAEPKLSAEETQNRAVFV